MSSNLSASDGRLLFGAVEKGLPGIKLLRHLMSERGVNYAFQKEAQFVVCLATRCLSPGREQLAQELIGLGLDWKRVRILSQEHGVIPLLYPHLISHYATAIPPPTLKDWSFDLSANAMHSLYLSAQLVDLCSLLENHGAKVISIKGPVLAKQIYGHVDMRQFGDLDLLIEETELELVGALLRQEGFSPNLLRLGTHSTRFFHDNTDSFKRARDSLVVDLHWRPTLRCFPFVPTFQELLARSTRVEIGGTVCTVSAEDNLLILCAHGARHGWTSLGDICDIAELMRSSQNLDYKYLDQQIRELDAGRILQLGLGLAHYIAGARLDEPLMRLFGSGAIVSRWCASVAGKLFTRKRKGSEEVPMATITLRTIPSLAGRLKYLLSRLFLPTGADFAFCPLPGSLLSFYYVLRPVRILKVIVERLAARPSVKKNRR
jgi:Uncharacterised nucleotidyltransferase